MEEIESLIKKVNLFKQPFTEISKKDLSDLTKRNISVEDFLDYISKKFDVLLHGSRNLIQDKIKAINNGIFATNLASIAIMESLISNIKCNLRYPYIISKKNPLVIEIENINSKTIGKKGFIYIISSDNFENYPDKSWQFLNKENKEVKILARVEISFKDFKYQIIDKTNNKRIQ